MALKRMISIGLVGLVGGLLALVPVSAQEATPEAILGPLTLSIWLPDLLVPPDNAEANRVLNAQIAAFEANETDVNVEIRLKRVGDVGGIMSVLRAASVVAPGAMPDVTLLRRADLVAAQRDGLIQSLEGDLSSALLGSLDTALKLGQINTTLYGAPYMLELLHLVYRGDSVPVWDYQAVLERPLPFVFAAGRATGLNDVVYLQYVAAGGTFSREGTLTLNEVALLDVLNFYAQLRDAQFINPTMLNYMQPSDYVSLLIDGDVDAGVLTSSGYLALLQTEASLKAAPLPTTAGQSISLMNGWMWVLVANEPEKQALALRFINQIMQTENQIAYARTVNWLPAQRQALLTTLPRNVDADLYAQLLDNSILPLADSEGGTLARAIQDAFVNVMNGEDPATVVETIVAQHGN